MYIIEIKGNEHTWEFPVEINPRYLKEWRADGLKIDELVNTVPNWKVLDFNLPILGKRIIPLPPTKLWCFFQDLSKNLLYWIFVMCSSVVLLLAIIKLIGG